MKTDLGFSALPEEGITSERMAGSSLIVEGGSPVSNLLEAASLKQVYPESKVHIGSHDANSLLEDFVTGSSYINEPMTADGRIKTFNEMDDEEIMRHLNEYLGSFITNTSINGALIETAQEILAEQFMSEQELEDLPDPKTPRGRAIRDLRMAERARDMAEDMAERRAQWDKDMHTIGGHQYSGADLHKINTYLLDANNQEDIEKHLMDTLGISREEAKKRRANLQDLSKLLEKERSGVKLTDEEQKRKQELQTGQAGKDYTLMADKVLGVEGQKYQSTVSAERTGQLSAGMMDSVTAGANIIGEPKAVTSSDIKVTGTSKANLYSVTENEDDFSKPLIKANALKPAFEKAEASLIPLDSQSEIKKAPAIVVASAVTAPQADGATF